MKYIASRLIFFLALSLLVCCHKHSYECDTEENVFKIEELIVASKTVTAQGANGLETCFWVKYNNNPDWQLFYDHINGFIHETGYEYTILVKIKPVVKPPQDVSSQEYTLLRIVSKEVKDSDVPFLTSDASQLSSSIHNTIPEQIEECYAEVIEEDIL